MFRRQYGRGRRFVRVVGGGGDSARRGGRRSSASRRAACRWARRSRRAIWVRERDAAHAREVIDQWRNQQENEPADWPDDANWPADKPPVEADEGPLPSDVRFRFLSQGFFIVALVCVLLGSIWAWQDWATRTTYSATAVGHVTNANIGPTSLVEVPRDPNLPLQPFDTERYTFRYAIILQYVYFVDHRRYHATLLADAGEKLQHTVTIHYDPSEPAQHLVGAITPPWVPLLLSFALAALLSFVGYQFR